MASKKKVLSTTKRGISRLTANMDGKRKGATQKQVEKAIDLLSKLEVCCILGNYRSLTAVIRKSAKRTAMAYLKKQKKLKAKK